MSTHNDTWSEQGLNQTVPPGESPFIKHLPNLLRFVGAGALLIAMYSFLVNGWQAGDDLFRYLIMLGHSGLLAAVGLMSGHLLKEGKGARLLLTLALVSVPANFAILGAFIASQSPDILLNQYPQYVTWSLDSLNSALMTSAGALLLLTPITLLGFTVLARGMSKRLTLLFLVSNLALLLPVREALEISMLVIVLTLGIVYFSSRAAQNQTASKTSEGIIALGLQLLPVAVLIGRNLWLYAPDLFLMAVMSMTVFFTLRQLSLYLSGHPNIRSVLNGLSLLPAIASAALLGQALSLNELLMNGLEGLIVPIVALVAFFMIIDIATRDQANSGFYRRIASASLAISYLLNLAVHASGLTALACVVAGIGLILHGLKGHDRSEFAAGIVLMLSGSIYQLYELFHQFDLSGWATLALIGLASIVIASTIESGGGKLKPRIDSLKAYFKQ